MYTNLKAKIITDRIGELVDILKGVKQGNLLSTILFSAILENFIRKFERSNKGIRNNLRFEDDIVLISKNIRLNRDDQRSSKRKSQSRISH